MSTVPYFPRPAPWVLFSRRSAAESLESERAMNSRVVLVLLAMLAAPAIGRGAESGSLSVATVQPLQAGTLTATGRVQALISARVSPRVSGHIVEFGVDESGRPLDVGMRVKAGQVLFRVNDTTSRNQVAMAEATLNTVQAALVNLTAKTRPEQMEQLKQAMIELDTRIADRQRDEQRHRRLVEQDKTLPPVRLEQVVTELTALRALRAAAQARYDMAANGPTPTEIAVAAARVKEAEAALKMAQDDLRDTVVKAPFDGLITRRFKSVGDYLVNMPPTDVLELITVDQLEAELHLPESYFASVDAGKTAVILRSLLLAESLKLTLTRVVGEIDPAKGTFAVRLAIPAEHRQGLVPGAFVNAEVDLNGKSASTIVPLRALVEGNGQPVVFVANGEKMSKRPVLLGDRLTEGVIVKSGLKAGEKVLLGTPDALQDGAPLPAYLQRK